ncbi:MAG TPA: hypothetical protein VMT16_04765 [Thermoanaerobaculia bacterium]|nr:hypothetical protein [Thermoanaerobaculia bacterium]
MRRDPLREALRSLPAGEPGPTFTAEVLGRLDGAARPAPGPYRRLAAAAAVALPLLAASAFGIDEWRQARREARLAALRAESGELARELEELRRSVEQPAGALYLGGTEDVDLVLNLTTLEAVVLAADPRTARRGGGRDAG